MVKIAIQDTLFTNFSKNTIIHYIANDNILHLIVKICALNIYLRIIRCVAGVKLSVHLLKEDALGGANETSAVAFAHFPGNSNGPTAPVFLGGIVVLPGHLVRRGAGTPGIGENVHIGKITFADERKTCIKFFLRFPGEGHDHICGDGAAGEYLI